MNSPIRYQLNRYIWHALRWSLLAALLASACAPLEERGARQKTPGAGQKIREAARQDRSIIEVYPLQDPVAQALLEQAREYESQGRWEWAAIQVNRALTVQPDDPQLLQYLAELQLQLGDSEQAQTLAQRSFSLGPKVGPLCSRNWRTIASAGEIAGNGEVVDEAGRQLRHCIQQAQPRF